MTRCGFLILFSLLLSPLVLSAADIVAFPSGDITLHGVLYKPEGPGPFPAVVYNHGSAAGMVSKSAFDALGPVFASHGWVFLGPYRRGQGLSASAGPYIGDQIDAAEKKGGISAGAAEMVRLLETDHLNDNWRPLRGCKSRASFSRIASLWPGPHSVASRPCWAPNKGTTARPSIQPGAPKVGHRRQSCKCV